MENFSFLAFLFDIVLRADKNRKPGNPFVVPMDVDIFKLRATENFVEQQVLNFLPLNLFPLSLLSRQ